MSTRKLSDKDLDKYFRKMLKKPETVPFDEAAWQGMQEKLSAAGTGSTIPKWLTISGIVGMVSLALFLLWQSPLLERTQGAEEASLKPLELTQEPTLIADSTERAEALHPGPVGANANDVVASNPTISETTPSTGTLAKPIHRVSESEQVEGGAAVSEPTSETPLESTLPLKKDVNSPEESPAAANEINPNAVQGDEHIVEPRDRSNDQELIKEAEFSSGQTFADPSAQAGAGSDETEQANSAPLLLLEKKGISARQLRAAFVPAPLLEPKAVAADTSDLADPTGTNRLWRDRLQVGISLAPDLTTVEELSEFDRAGLDVGVQLEYFITPRLSITTGAILTRKIYRTTDLTEYQVPEGFWTNGVWPEQINANCKVVDIPINVRYRAIEGPRTSFFISAGVSSYLMLTEVYEYNYGYANQDPSNRSRSEFENENQHYLGVYNLSFGLARRVGKNISIEVEPYLKNSMGRVGWGRTQLKSTGALFHLKYHLGTQ